jgi:hypothetical protein
MAELSNQPESVASSVSANARSDCEGWSELPVVAERELLRAQLSSYLDVYKHHFDLFVKGVFGYFVVVGALTNFAFDEGQPVRRGVLFALTISIASVIAFFSCVISREWVKDLERAVRRITDALSGEPFPFSGAKGILGIMMVISVIFCIGGFVELWNLKSGIKTPAIPLNHATWF